MHHLQVLSRPTGRADEPLWPVSLHLDSGERTPFLGEEAGALATVSRVRHVSSPVSQRRQASTSQASQSTVAGSADASVTGMMSCGPTGAVRRPCCLLVALGQSAVNLQDAKTTPNFPPCSATRAFRPPAQTRSECIVLDLFLIAYREHGSSELRRSRWSKLQLQRYLDVGRPRRSSVDVRRDMRSMRGIGLCHIIAIHIAPEISSPRISLHYNSPSHHAQAFPTIKMPHKEDSNITIKELHPTFAAELHGVDFQNLDDAQFDEIYKAITKVS